MEICQLFYEIMQENHDKNFKKQNVKINVMCIDYLIFYIVPHRLFQEKHIELS